MKRIYLSTALIMCLFISISCEKEYLNPSSLSEQQAIADTDGLIGIANGLQYRYSTGLTTTSGNSSCLYANVVASGCPTNEFKVLNQVQVSQQNLVLGGVSVIGNNNIVSNLWNQSNLIKYRADIIFNNIANAADKADQSGLIGYASIFKALSLGHLGTLLGASPYRQR